MNRNDAFHEVNEERARQDKTWKDRSQYSRYAPHILILEELIGKLRTDWYASEKEVLQSRVVKIAAVAIRALEEVQS